MNIHRVLDSVSLIILAKALTFYSRVWQNCPTDINCYRRATRSQPSCLPRYDLFSVSFVAGASSSVHKEQPRWIWVERGNARTGSRQFYVTLKRRVATIFIRSAFKRSRKALFVSRFPRRESVFEARSQRLFLFLFRFRNNRRCSWASCAPERKARL